MKQIDQQVAGGKPEIKKRYKKRPSHLFWFNEGQYQKIHPMGGNLNLLNYIVDSEEKGNVIIGYNLFHNSRKITEKEYNQQIESITNKPQ